MVSQFVMGIRTYNLSQRLRNVGLVILVLYVAICTAQWVSVLYRSATSNSAESQCRRVVNHARSFGAWTFYMVAIINDSIVTTISFRYLMKYYFSATTSVMSNVTEIMICDGLGYFVLLTVTNIFNLILLRTSEQTQSAAVSLSYVATWIMTQRILIDLHEASLKRQDRDEVVTITKSIKSPQEASHAIRTQFESNKDDDWTEPSLDGASSAERGEQPCVQVRVERTMRVEDHPWIVERGLLRSRVPGAEYESWSTATHDTRDEAIRAARDPTMVTIR